MRRDRQSRVNLWFGLPFLLIAVGALGWYGYHRVLYTFAQPTSVHITRPQIGRFAALDVTVTNSQLVQEMYSGLKSFKPMPNGVHSCPADFGVEYQLTFKTGHLTIVTAQADPNGCEVISLSTGQTLWGITTNPKGDVFWNTLAKALNLSDSSQLGGPS